MRGTALAGVLAAALIGLTGCGSEPKPAASPTPSAESPASAAPSPTTAAATVIVIVAGGKVTAGGGRHEIKLGTKVVLEFTSDAADEVHVHGYDKEVALKPGVSARIEFTANIPGVFEVELHESGLALCELQVQ
ncbi:MAG: hypothetical protein ACRDT4_22230 [Micromonosporaceae bacterium]